MTDATPDSSYRVTLKDVDKKVDENGKEMRDGFAAILQRLPDDANVRLRKVEQQVAAQWVVVGIVVVALGALLTRSLTILT